MNGDHARAAELLAALAEAQPGQVDIAQQGADRGDRRRRMDLALELAPRVPPAKLTTEARLLLVAEAIRSSSRIDRALPWLAVSGDNGDLSFLAPLLTAWDAAERGDLDQAPRTYRRDPGEQPAGAVGRRGAGA